MPGRPRGSRNKEADQTWIDRFCTMPAADREAALKLMESNHRAICLSEAARQPVRQAVPKENENLECVVRRAAKNGETATYGELDLTNDAEIAEAIAAANPLGI